MKTIMLIAFLLFVLPVHAQNISLDIQGNCIEYNVTLVAAGLEEGCYDVKIDVTTQRGRGEIFDPRQGWKSSFYYINEILCLENTTETSRTFQLRAPLGDEVNFMAKLKSVSGTWESSYYTVEEKCPSTLLDEISTAVIAALAVILILLSAVTFYVRHVPGKKRKK